MTVQIDASYQLGTFRDNQDSLRRLKRQASIVTELELRYLEQAGLKGNTRVMDIGCGPGIVSAAIASHCLPTRLVAGDVNAPSLDETRRQFKNAGVDNAEVRQLNVYDEQLSEVGQFDFVYSRLLFQHLSEPLFALMNLGACLAPGGRLCICDIDDDWLKITPPVRALKPFIERVGKSQLARGGDRNVGTKLSGYMKASGYSNIRSEVLLLSTDLVTKEAFYDLVFGYKMEVVPQPELAPAQAELKDVRAAIDAVDGWAAIAVFFVSGEKSASEEDS